MDAIWGTRHVLVLLTLNNHSPFPLAFVCDKLLVLFSGTAITSPAAISIRYSPAL